MRRELGDEGEQGDRSEDEHEVRQRGRVLDALLVDERVAGDRHADHEREGDSATIDGAVDTAHEDHADADQDHTHRLPHTERNARERCARQHEHRRRPASDRVRRGSDLTVGMQSSGARSTQARARRTRRSTGRPRLSTCHVAGSEWSEEDDRDDESDGGCGAHVACACEQGVPRRVQNGSAQCESERGAGHGLRCRARSSLKTAGAYIRVSRSPTGAGRASSRPTSSGPSAGCPARTTARDEKETVEWSDELQRLGMERFPTGAYLV